jgi:hypothetical protein
MRAGTDVHAQLHREAVGQLAKQARDGRCFVATALWGSTDPRTRALRAWRDDWLLKRCWGAAAVRLYYWLSPSFVDILARLPGMRAFLDVMLSFVARGLTSRRE